MKKFKFLLVIVLLVIFGNTNAQDLGMYSISKIRVETGEGKDKKVGDGYFYIFQLTKDKINYSAILISKELVNNAPTINIFLNKKVDDKTDVPYLFKVPNNAEYVLQNNDKENNLAVIPYGKIHTELDKKNIETDQIFLTDGFLSLYKIPIKESDVAKMKAIWEAKL